MVETKECPHCHEPYEVGRGCQTCKIKRDLAARKKKRKVDNLPDWVSKVWPDGIVKERLNHEGT